MQPERFWRCGRFLIQLGRRTLLMAIINVTPDSFSGDGIPEDPGAAIESGLRAVSQGADILDVGGESTRPGHALVEEKEELLRVLPVIHGLARQVNVPISVDTSKPAVAAAALYAGASIVNDVSGLALSDAAARFAAQANAGLVLMRFPGFPRNQPRARGQEEGDLLAAIHADLLKSVRRAHAAGAAPDTIAVDPGFGFGILPADSLRLLGRLGELKGIGYPLLVGVSRKGFTGQPHRLAVAERQWATAAAHTLAIAHGTDVLRVHDVLAARRVADFVDLVVR